MRRFAGSAWLVAALLVALSGCAGEDAGDDDFVPSPTPTPSGTATVTPTPTPVPTAPVTPFSGTTTWGGDNGEELWVKVDSNFDGYLQVLRAVELAPPLGEDPYVVELDLMVAGSGYMLSSGGKYVFLMDEAALAGTVAPPVAPAQYQIDYDYDFGAGTVAGADQNTSSTTFFAGDNFLSGVSAKCAAPSSLRFEVTSTQPVTITQVRVYDSISIGLELATLDVTTGNAVCDLTDPAWIPMGTSEFDGCEFAARPTLMPADNVYVAVFRGYDDLEGDHFLQYVPFNYTDVTNGFCFPDGP